VARFVTPALGDVMRRPWSISKGDYLFHRIADSLFRTDCADLRGLA